MNTRSTLILGIIAAGLALYIGLALWDAPTTGQIEKDAQKLFTGKSEQVNKVEITNSHGSFIFNRVGTSEEWKIQKPIEFPANTTPISSLIGELGFQKRIDTLDAASLSNWSEALKQFGLAEPRIKTTLHLTEGEPFILSLGRKTAISGGVYGLLQSNGKENIESFLSKDLEEWRSHDLFRYEVAKVSSIRLREDDKETELQHSEGKWNILKPIATAADGIAVNDYLGEMLRLQAERYVSENGAGLATYGLDAPKASLQIAHDGKTSILNIGSEVPKPSEPNSTANNQPDPLQGKNFVFASMDGYPGVFVFDRTSIPGSAALTARLRDRALVSFKRPEDISKLSITTPTLTFNIERRNHSTTSWWDTDFGKPLDQDKVNLLINNLAIAKVDEFPTLKSPDIAGLQKPATTLTLFNPYLPPYEGEEIKTNTDSKKEVGRTEILKFGKTKDALQYVSTTAQKAIGLISQKVLENMPKNKADFFHRQIFLFDQTPMKEIRWKKGKETYAIRRDGLNPWMAQGEGKTVDLGIAGLQEEKLVSLEAVRWTGPAVERDYTNPLLEITLVKPEREIKLTIGKKLSDGTYSARIDKEPYGFLISEADYQALQLNPLNRAQVAPAASP